MTIPPFFIVGCARSGTTLLRAMLHNHPLIAIPVESLFMIDYLRASESVPLSIAQTLILKEFEFREWKLSISASELQSCQTVSETFSLLHERYASMLGKRYWGQKTPRFVRYGDLLRSVFPNARFIHMIRDPRAIALSLRRSNVHSSNYYYGARRWLKDVQAGLALKARYPDAVLEIHYEALVSQPEETLHQVAAFLDIPYDPQMLQYQDSAQDYNQYFSSIHSNLRKPPTAERMDAWRKVISPIDTAMIEQICMPLMQQLGYIPEQFDLKVPKWHIQQHKLDRMTRGILSQVLQYFNGRSYHLFYSIYRKARLGLLLKDIVQIHY